MKRGTRRVLHGREIAEGEGVRQRPVLAEALLQIGALDVVKAARVAAVVAGEDAALRVDLQAEGVAAALGEDFVAARLRVIAPDELAHRVDRRLLAAVVLDVAGDGAALAGVQPAVRPPLQAVGAGVGVFQAEAFQQDLRRAVGHVVVVLVRVEEEVRRIEHPQAAAALDAGGGDVQPLDEGLVLVEDAVAVACLRGW